MPACPTRIRTTLLAACALAVLAAVAGLVPTAGPAAATTVKTLVGVLTSDPGRIIGPSGSATITTSVSQATSCTFTANRPVTGLPVTVPCTDGSVSTAVEFPKDTRTKPVVYVVSMTATGLTTAKAKPVKVTVVPGAGGPPVATTPLSGVSSVAGDGLDAYCAVIGGGVSCWGSNGAGQLGDGTTTSRPLARPVVGVGGTGLLTGVTRVIGGRSLADHMFCALLSSGGVDCWGADQWGQLGDGSTVASPVPRAVVGVGGTGTLDGVTALVGGGEGFCAVLASGGVDCWGQGIFGQLGNGTNVSSATPVAVQVLGGQLLAGVVSVTADAALGGFCALRGDGTVDCWGHNIFEQLGIGIWPGPTNCGGDPCAEVARPVVGTGGTGQLTGVTGLAGDGATMCALLASGGVDCWGGNTHGQLGNGTTTPSDVPVTVLAPGGTTPFSGAVAVVNDRDIAFCAVLASGGVQCWGDNAVGELGSGTTSGPSSCGGRACSTTAVDVVGGPGGAGGSAGLLGVAGLVSAPSTFAGGTVCAVTTTSSLVCWGTGYLGQSGIGSMADSGVPAPVVQAYGTAPLGPVTSVATGRSSYCVVLASGGAACWGANASGQLGDGTAASRSGAAPVLAG